MILIALLAGTGTSRRRAFPVTAGTIRPGGPVARPADAHARRRPGGDPVALRALVDARRAQPGLHPHGPGEGPDQGRGAVRPRAAQRLDPGGLDRRRPARQPARRVVVIESVFNLPGVGQMLLRDIGNRDFDKVQGTVLLIAVVVLVIGFLVDVAHYLIDPRLRTGAG